MVDNNPEGPEKTKNDSMSPDDYVLKKNGMVAFTAIVVSATFAGLRALYYMQPVNAPIYQNAIELNEIAINHCIAKMGFISIIILVSILIGFVGINYLSHPTEWSTKMIDKGRTLEYITVILIVGIVLILALVKILEGETVGTILGTIAGYVLGKSVGPKGN